MLDKAVCEAQGNAFASGTSKNFKSQWNTYFAFCNYYNLQPLPCSGHNMCRYITLLSHSLHSYQSVKNYVHGVRTLHKAYSLDCSFLDSFNVKLVLLSAKKRLGCTPLTKLPITPSILLKVKSLMNLNVPLYSVLWCAFLIAFFAFLRKSNLVPPSNSGFDPAMHLARNSILRTDYGLLITFHKSKTVQCRERTITIPVTAIPGSPLDPVAAFDHMCQLIPAPSPTPAFSYPTASGLTSLTHTTLTSHMRKLLQSAGLNPLSYAGHSFRRGGCTTAFMAGVPTELIQAHGDWHSSAYLCYLTHPLSHQLTVTQRMAHVLNTL